VKRTGVGILVVAGLLGLAAGFALNQVLSSSGRATFTPMLTLPILLAVLGGVVVVLALPIRRATTGRSGEKVNPFWALRVAMLAKASSIVGAGFAGFGAGLGMFLATRPVTPSLGSWGAIIATALCGALLIAAGLIAEHLCTIGKDDDDEQPGGDDGGLRPRLHDH
jgi:hypothetical protein